MITRVGALGVGVLITGVLLAGCQSAGSRATPTSASPLPALSDVGKLSQVTTARITTTKGLFLPIERYDATPAERKVVSDAISASVASCMAHYGLGWQPSPSASDTPTPQLARAYGIADRSTALKQGYHPDPGVTKPQPQSPKLTPEQTAVYTGAHDSSGKPKAMSFQGKKVPAGGCAQQGLSSVTSDPNLDPDSVADQLLVAMGSRARADARVVTAIAAWSKCMVASGYHYSDPLDALNRATAPGSTPTAAEIRTAVTDIDCKNKVNLLGTWYAVDSGYENLAIRQSHVQLASVQSAWRAAVTKASAILGVPVPPPAAD